MSKPIAPVLSDAESDAIEREAFGNTEPWSVSREDIALAFYAAGFAAAQSEPQGVPRETNWQQRQAGVDVYRQGMRETESINNFCQRIFQAMYDVWHDAAPPATPDKVSGEPAFRAGMNLFAVPPAPAAGSPADKERDAFWGAADKPPTPDDGRSDADETDAGRVFELQVRLREKTIDLALANRARVAAESRLALAVGLLRELNAAELAMVSREDYWSAVEASKRVWQRVLEFLAKTGSGNG